MFNASETTQMKPSQYLLRRSKSKMKKIGGFGEKNLLGYMAGFRYLGI